LIQYLKTLNPENICDNDDFNMKFYIIIFVLGEIIYPNKYLEAKYYIPNIFNKLIPCFHEYINFPLNANIIVTYNTYIKKLAGNLFEISNGYEKKIIDENNYNIESLSDDLKIYSDYPLDILLYRHESINYFNSINKSFIEREELLEDFKNYFFQFIKSKFFTDIFSLNIYKNVKEFFENKDIEKILFNKNYLKFIPFPTKTYFGFTNKDLLVSFISCYPVLLENIIIENSYVDFKNFCLLMSIGEKFLTLVYEHALNFIFYYLNHLTNDSNFISPKCASKKKSEKIEFKNGEAFFKYNLLGRGKDRCFFFTYNIICLLDGEMIKRPSKEFIKIFNSDFDLNTTVEKVKKCSGFLKKFLEKYPIDFNKVFKTNQIDQVYIPTKGSYESFFKIPNFKSSFSAYDIMSQEEEKLKYMEK